MFLWSNMTDYNSTVTANYEFDYMTLPAIIICIFGVVFNTLLLVAFIKDPLKCFRNSGTYLLMNLSVADCSVCFSCAVYLLAFSSLLRAIIPLPMTLFGVSSVFSIISTSIDRYLTVAYPIKHRIFVNSKRLFWWLVTIWTVSCAIAVLNSVHRILEEENRIIMYSCGAMFVILSAVFYAATYHKLKQQSKSIALQNSKDSSAQEIRIRKEKRFLNTIILIACIALVCIVPSLAFFQIQASLGLKNNAYAITISNLCACILYTNFAVNPLIYITRLPNYRKTFYLLYCFKTPASPNGGCHVH